MNDSLEAVVAENRLLRVSVIAHELLGFSPAGGMGTATSFLALALARMGHSVEVLLGGNDPRAMQPHWRETYESAGISIRATPPLDAHVEPWYFAHLRAVELGLRANPPDVVVAHDFGAPAYSALRLREAGLAFQDTLFVVFCHGTRRYVLDLLRNVAVSDLTHVLAIGVLEQRAIELADAAVSPSAYLVNWMQEHGWRLPEETHVVPYFARSSVTDGAVQRAEYREGDALRRLVFFGRVDERKGLTLFAAALNALDAKLLCDLNVEFIGKTTGTWTPARAKALLAEPTRRVLGSVTFTGELDQNEAFERLTRPGTLVVMPSLSETFSNTVYECLERDIPFLATNVGGVPELIAPADRERVLCDPTAAGVENALRRILAEGIVPLPARLAFERSAPLEGWADVLQLRPRPQGELPADAVDDAVDVMVVKENERPTIPPGSAPFVLIRGEQDFADADAVRTLMRAQRASGADVVTCGVRLETNGRPTMHFFSGEPAGLGALVNDYGRIALVRRSMLDPTPSPPAGSDPAWTILAGLSASGARFASIPEPLARSSSEPGNVNDDAVDALAVAQQLERALPAAGRSASRIGAGLAANSISELAPRRTYRIALAVALTTAIAAAIRLSTLGRQSYWYDELATVSLLRHSFTGMLHAIPRREATPYLYYLVAWPWTRLFGAGEAGLRSLSAIAGTVTVPLTYGVGKRVASPRIGLIAAALVAVNPFLVWYSQEARAYALFALLAAGTLYFFAAALGGDTRALVGWSVTAALAIATHYFAVFIVAAEGLWLVLHHRRRALTATLLPLAAVLAEVPLLLKQRNNGGNLSHSPLLHRVVGVPKDLIVGYSFPAEFAGTVFAALLVLLGLGLVFASRRHAPRRRTFLLGAIAASMIVGPIVLALGGADYVTGRNMIAAVVPATIFVAAGYATRRIGMFAAAALCALSLAIVGTVAAETRYGRTDWRGAARALGRSTVPRAIVVTPTIDNVLWRPYLRGLSEPVVASLRVAEIDVVGLATQGGSSTTAVHPPRTPPRPAPRGFRLVETRRTPTYVLVRYRARGPRRVPSAALAALQLSSLPGPVFFQGAGLPPR